MIRHQEGRSVRVWEVMVLNGVMLPEIVEDLLESLCKSDAGGEGLNMLGRVLVELGYATREQLEESLAIQAQERASGTWRLIGQILVEKGFAAKINFRMLDILESCRNLSNPARSSSTTRNTLLARVEPLFVAMAEEHCALFDIARGVSDGSHGRDTDRSGKHRD